MKLINGVSSDTAREYQTLQEKEYRAIRTVFSSLFASRAFRVLSVAMISTHCLCCGSSVCAKSITLSLTSVKNVDCENCGATDYEVERRIVSDSAYRATPQSLQFSDPKLLLG